MHVPWWLNSTLDYYYYCYYRGAWRSTFYNFKYFAPHFSNARYYLFCLCHTERVFYWLDQFNIHELSAKKRESDPENAQKIGARFFKLNQFLILGSRLEFQLPTEKWIRPIKLQWFNVILIWWHSTTPSLQHTFFHSHTIRVLRCTFSGFYCTSFACSLSFVGDAFFPHLWFWCSTLYISHYVQTFICGDIHWQSQCQQLHNMNYLQNSPTTWNDNDEQTSC